MNPWMTDADESALAQFEAIALSQRPADTPWEPVTDYSWAVREPIDRPRADLIWRHLIPCDDADVLDYGCGARPYLVRLLREFAVRDRVEVLIAGYDPQAPNEDGFSREVPTDVYDLVTCREVLEHLPLRQLRHTVSELCRLSAHLLYITTRFTPNPTSLLAVAQSDDLDPTHITMCNQAFLRALIVLEGFKRRADLEQQCEWNHNGRVLVYERT